MLRVIGGIAKSIVYLGNDYDPADLSTYTFTSQPLGDEGGSRVICVAVTDFDILQTVTSVTIGGESASKIAQSEGTANSRVTLWSAVVPTGTSGDIVVTLDGVGVSMGIDFWALYGLSSTTPYDTDGDSTFSVSGATLDIPARGIVLMHTVEVQSGAGTFTWSGGTVTDADEDYDYDKATGIRVAGVSKADLAAATGATLTATESGGRNQEFVAASWG